MSTPLPRSVAAACFVLFGSSWSLMNLSWSGRPFTPPAALILAISACAAPSAGASKGAMFLVRSTAAPITIGVPAAGLPAAPPTNTARARVSTPSAAHAVLRLISPPLRRGVALPNTNRSCLPTLQERVPPPASELRRGKVPERIGIRAAERAVVREDLEVVRPRPAGSLQRREDRRDAGHALAGEHAVGPAAGRLTPVVDLHRHEEVGVLANV